MDSTDELDTASRGRKSNSRNSTRPIKKNSPRSTKKNAELSRKKVRIAQNRFSAAERKRRTRRLILMGSYIEHITVNDEAAKDRLMKGLDGFLDRKRDRDMFGLPQTRRMLMATQTEPARMLSFALFEVWMWTPT